LLRAAGASMVQKLQAVQENTGGSQGVCGRRTVALHIFISVQGAENECMTVIRLERKMA